jgi:hypothetical protein
MAEDHASKAGEERLLRRAREGIGASTVSTGEGEGGTAAAGSSEEEMTVRLMVEFLTPAEVAEVVVLSEDEEVEEVSTTAEWEPVEVVDLTASSAPREDESITMEWSPVDLSRARPGRMLTWTVESSMPAEEESEEEAPAEETSTRTELSPRLTLRRTVRFFEDAEFRLMLTVELWKPPIAPAPEVEASMWMLWC